MKSLLTSLALLLSLSLAHAQSDSSLINKQGSDGHKNYILQILNLQSQSDALAKPTGMQQRVIAQAINIGAFTDSSTFSYTGSRGSKFNYNRVTYGDIIVNLYEPAFIYPSAMRSFDMLADTICNYENDTLSYKDYGTYRTDNKLSAIYTEFGDDYPWDLSRTILNYNTMGFPDAEYYYLYSEGDPVDTNSVTRHYYAGQQMHRDSSWEKQNNDWIFVAIRKYNYNASGKLISDSTFAASVSALELTRSRTLSYYPDGKLRTLSSIAFFENEPYDIRADSFGYSPGANYLTYWHSTVDRPDLNYSSIETGIRYPGVNGLPDSAKSTTTTNNVTTMSKHLYQYNSFDNPEQISVFQGPNTDILSLTYKFYYETYDDGLSADEFKDDMGINVYPNPFLNYFEITWKEAPTQPCRIKLLNAIGQEVYSITASFSPGNLNISVPNLADGYYTLLIENNDGQIIRKKLVKKG